MDVNLIPLVPMVQVLLTALIVIVRDLFIDDREPSLIGLGLAAPERDTLGDSIPAPAGDP
jgi:hypothetical protein